MRQLDTISVLLQPIVLLLLFLYATDNTNMNYVSKTFQILSRNHKYKLSILSNFSNGIKLPNQNFMIGSIFSTESTKKHVDSELTEKDEDSATKNQDELEIEEMKDISQWNDEQIPPDEKNVKRKISYFTTNYAKAMQEEEPENELEILEYYVKKAQENLEETDDAEYYDVIQPDKRLFFKMVDMWIKDAGEPRRGHREFLQVAMNNVERFNVHNEPKAYLKILECYPQSKHTGMRRPQWFKSVWQDKIIDHELGMRLFGIMHKNSVTPTDEFYTTCMRLFGPYSRATVFIRNMLFWYPRLSSFDPFPIENRVLETMTPLEIAFRGLRQLSPALDAIYEKFEIGLTTLEEDEKAISEGGLDIILSVQTANQRELLEKHDVLQPIYVEGPHTAYFKGKKMNYFVMRADPRKKEIIVNERTKILTDKEWWIQFYQKDFKTDKSLSKTGEIYSEESFLPKVNIEKGLTVVDQRPNEIEQVCDDVKAVEGDVFSIAITDYESPNALRNWVKGLHRSNPILSELTVVFKKKNSFLTEGYKSAAKRKSFK